MAKPETYTISVVSHEKCEIGDAVQTYSVDRGGAPREFRYAIEIVRECGVLHERMGWLEEHKK